MKPMSILALAVASAACVVAAMPFTAGDSDDEASPIYGVRLPQGYRDWHLIAVAQLAGGKSDDMPVVKAHMALKQLRAQLGNDIAIKAFREGSSHSLTAQ
jgi:hypothetical protein